MTDPAAAPAEPAAPAALACLNCGHVLGQTPQRFCPQCGQETRLRPPTLGEFVQQFGGAYLSTEGALWRTLALLLLRPGELTRRYLAGRRKHYVLPLRLYLTISVIVLLLMRALAGQGLEGRPGLDVQVDGGDSLNSLVIDLGKGRAGMKDGRFFCTDLPAWLCKRIQRRIDVDLPGLQRQMEQVGERMLGQIGSALFVMLPAFALWLKLVYVDRRLHYTEHLVFALHLHAFWFLALALALPGISGLTTVAVLLVPLYGLLAMRRVYGGRWWSLLLRDA